MSIYYYACSAHPLTLLILVEKYQIDDKMNRRNDFCFVFKSLDFLAFTAFTTSRSFEHFPVALLCSFHFQKAIREINSNEEKKIEQTQNVG